MNPLSLKAELEYMIKNGIGFHWVILRQLDRSKKCDCVNEGGCTKCFGTGYLYTDYLIQGLKYRPTGSEKRNDETYKAGIVIKQGHKYIVQLQYHPSNGDLILEVDLHRDTGQPFIPIRIVEVHDIQSSRLLWGDYEKGQYYILSCKNRQSYPGEFRQ